MSNTTCMAPDCEAATVGRGNCQIHYSRLRHLIIRTKGGDEPVTWELLVDAGLATPKTSPPGRPVSEFTAGVLAVLAEHRSVRERLPEFGQVDQPDNEGETP